MRQAYNLTRAGQIATDLLLDAKNYTYRLKDKGSSIEMDHIRYFLAKFTQCNVDLNTAIQLEGKEIRLKRNIFGNILSTLTGLVTQEEMEKQQGSVRKLSCPFIQILYMHIRYWQKLPPLIVTCR